MTYYIEGTITHFSLVKETFRIAPKKEYQQEKDGKKRLFVIEKNGEYKSTLASAGETVDACNALLLDIDSDFKLNRRGCRLVFLSNAKPAVGVEIEITDPARISEPIPVVDVFIL